VLYREILQDYVSLSFVLALTCQIEKCMQDYICLSITWNTCVCHDVMHTKSYLYLVVKCIITIRSTCTRL